MNSPHSDLSSGQNPYRISDELLSAYVDNAVTPHERALIEEAVAADAETAWRLKTLQQTVSLLQQLPELAVPRSFALRENQVAETLQARQQANEQPVVGTSSGNFFGNLGEALRSFWQPGNPLLRNAAAVAFVLFLVFVSADAFMGADASENSQVSTLADSAPQANDSIAMVEKQAPNDPSQAVTPEQMARVAPTTVSTTGNTGMGADSAASVEEEAVVEAGAESGEEEAAGEEEGEADEEADSIEPVIPATTEQENRDPDSSAQANVASVSPAAESSAEEPVVAAAMAAPPIESTELPDETPQLYAPEAGAEAGTAPSGAAASDIARSAQPNSAVASEGSGQALPSGDGEVVPPFMRSQGETALPQEPSSADEAEGSGEDSASAEVVDDAAAEAAAEAVAIAPTSTPIPSPVSSPTPTAQPTEVATEQAIALAEPPDSGDTAATVAEPAVSTPGSLTTLANSMLDPLRILQLGAALFTVAFALLWWKSRAHSRQS